MRIAQLSILTLATSFTAMTACGGGSCPDGSKPVDDQCPCEDGGTEYAADFDGGVCPLDCDSPFEYDFTEDACLLTCDDGEVIQEGDECVAPVTYFEPVAVGFELISGVGGDGTLTTFTTGTTESPPLMVITFADVEFFSAQNTDDQIGHHCEAIGVFAPTAERTEPLPGPSGPITAWHSYEVAFAIDQGTFDSTDETGCGATLDPATWGRGGTNDLFAAFNGIRLGVAFGPLTANLRTTLEDAGASDEYLSGSFTEYIAINDKDGVWVAEDWTTASLFEWDETTNTPTTDSSGALTTKAFYDKDTDTYSAPPLPSGYLQSSAFWYQDFPLMDLSNLKDGAPTE